MSNLFERATNVQSSDYKSAGSNQVECLNYELVTDSGVWEEIYTVPAAKTYYVTFIIVARDYDAGYSELEIGTGAIASEVTFLKTSILSSQTMNFSTPIKFAGGTRIAVKTNTDDNCYFTIVGWIEG